MHPAPQHQAQHEELRRKGWWVVGDANAALHGMVWYRPAQFNGYFNQNAAASYQLSLELRAVKQRLEWWEICCAKWLLSIALTVTIAVAIWLFLAGAMMIDAAQVKDLVAEHGGGLAIGQVCGLFLIRLLFMTFPNRHTNSPPHY